MLTSVPTIRHESRKTPFETAISSAFSHGKPDANPRIVSAAASDAESAITCNRVVPWDNEVADDTANNNNISAPIKIIDTTAVDPESTFQSAAGKFLLRSGSLAVSEP